MKSAEAWADEMESALDGHPSSFDYRDFVRSIQRDALKAAAKKAKADEICTISYEVGCGVECASGCEKILSLFPKD